MLSNDIKERDGSERKTMTRIPFTLKHLEPCRVRMSKMSVCLRRVRCTVCTSRRVQGSCHCLDAKSRKKQLQIHNQGISLVEVCNTKKKRQDGDHVLMWTTSDLVFEIVLLVS